MPSIKPCGVAYNKFNPVFVDELDNEGSATDFELDDDDDVQDLENMDSDASKSERDPGRMTA